MQFCMRFTKNQRRFLDHIVEIFELISHLRIFHSLTSFDAECHLNYFQKALRVYVISFNDWCICLIEHNVTVNYRIAILCDKPQDGCTSH